MATDYAKFQALALRLIGNAGRPVSVKTTTYTPNPATPWKIGDAATTETLQATTGAFFDEDDVIAFADLVVKLTQGAGATDRTNVQAASTQCWIPAVDLIGPPTVADTLVDGADEWEITDVGVIGPGPLPVVYILGVSR